MSSSVSSQYSLCDNIWHKVKITVRQNVLSLQVDEGSIVEDSLPNRLASTDTQAPLYIGGSDGRSSHIQ